MGGRVCCLFLYLQSAAFSWCRASEEWQDVTFIHLLVAHTMRPRARPALSPRGRRAPPAPPRRHLAPAGTGTAAPQLGPAAHTARKRKIEKKIIARLPVSSLENKQELSRTAAWEGGREGSPGAPGEPPLVGEWPGHAAASFTLCVGQSSLFPPGLGRMSPVLPCRGQTHLGPRPDAVLA